jgi:hypothetical protein
MSQPSSSIMTKNASKGLDVLSLIIPYHQRPLALSNMTEDVQGYLGGMNVVQADAVDSK